jgi:hypothetical protein
MNNDMQECLNCIIILLAYLVIILSVILSFVVLTRV